MIKRAFSMIFAFLLVVGAVNANEFSLTPSHDDLVYPTDKNFTANVFIKKGLLDNIVDIKLTLQLNGPAKFDDKTDHKDINIGNLGEDYNQDFFVILEDTASSTREYVTMTLTGSYVSNAVFGGGKKPVDIEKKIPYISSDKSKVEIEKKVYEDLYSACVDDKAELEEMIKGLNSEIIGKDTKINTLKSQLESKTCPETECPSCPEVTNPKWDQKHIGMAIVILFLLLILFINRGRKSPST